MNSLCAGSHTSGKTERGEVNVFIPGKDIGGMAERLKKRIDDYGGASLHEKGAFWIGSSHCKYCSRLRKPKTQKGDK